MDTRKIAKDYRMATWAQLIRERSESGQNVRDFCKSKGIHENTFYYWKRKLREASTQELRLTTQETQQPTRIPRGWAVAAKTDPEPPVPEPRPMHTLPIEIGSCRVMVSSDTTPELLAKVCKVLVELC